MDLRFLFFYQGQRRKLKSEPDNAELYFCCGSLVRLLAAPSLPEERDATNIHSHNVLVNKCKTLKHFDNKKVTSEMGIEKSVLSTSTNVGREMDVRVGYKCYTLGEET